MKNATHSCQQCFSQMHSYMTSPFSMKNRERWEQYERDCDQVDRSGWTRQNSKLRCMRCGQKKLDNANIQRVFLGIREKRQK